MQGDVKVNKVEENKNIISKISKIDNSLIQNLQENSISELNLPSRIFDKEYT